MKISRDEAMKNPVLKAAIEGTLKPPGVAQARESMLQGVNPAYPLAKAKGRKRRQLGVMNKLESSFAAYLEAEKQAGRILEWRFESVRVKLANNTTLLPDFYVLTAGHFEEFYEVKGAHVWDDSLVKLKVAAAQWWWWTFKLVKRKKARDGGGWDIREIKAA